jgi:hypothetical protein
LGNLVFVTIWFVGPALLVVALQVGQVVRANRVAFVATHLGVQFMGVANIALGFDLDLAVGYFGAQSAKLGHGVSLLLCVGVGTSTETTGDF